MEPIDELLLLMPEVVKELLAKHGLPYLPPDLSYATPKRTKGRKVKRIGQDEKPDYSNVELYPNRCEWCPDVKGHCAYIIRCKDGTNYKGYSGNLRNRMIAHFNGLGSKYTRDHNPSFLLHFEVFDDRKSALDREQFFKKNWNWIRGNTGQFKSLYPPEYISTLSQEPAMHAQINHIDLSSLASE